MKATYKGHLLAESDDTVILENNHYFPAESLDMSSFSASEHTSYCGWKGDCKYYNIVVDGVTNANAAWTYPEPFAKAQEIKGRVAFWKGVVVEA